MTVRHAESSDIAAVMALAADVIGPERAGPFVRSHAERHHLMVAEEAGEVVGVLAYRTDWFQCTFVSLVAVRENFRRRGAGPARLQNGRGLSPGPRLVFSTPGSHTA